MASLMSLSSCTFQPTHIKISNMLVSTLIASVGLFGSALGGLIPRSFGIPKGDGFPNPSDSQERQIALQAGGKLPGGPLPKTLGSGSTTAFQLIAFNELFETAFFSSLLHNITQGVKGYEVPANERRASELIIKTILAQEEQHAIGALATLKSAGKFAPSPCRYKFPVNKLDDAIFLAETFTAVVLGALQDANVVFASEGQPEIVRLVSSVIGQEGEQNGFYRIHLGEIPSESPFLTTVPAAFAWSALQLFVVPGSCSNNIKNIHIPIFPPLLVNGGPVAKVAPKDQTLKFKANLKGYKPAKKYYGSSGNLYITYTTGQQLPISVKAKNVRWHGDTITLEAKFPYTENIMAGFSHAALTTGKNFASADAVVGQTLAAPGVIQVRNPI
ncbi:hypothetical protein EDB81DRAFT_913262 [Dactylonectria macrodidyma]|uniref:Late sexual development protein n=1 Tax=Dactylonectria macrodidyma TaxID=307937 RepID=A0A9P9IL25_9HYPO|nr:hypothetical protein EDB81DRAFT_913262 [Dactylonectria macrodidyma]